MNRGDMLRDQRGLALISALLLLLVISLMAVGVSTDTSMDVRIAGFIKFKTVSSASVESGLVATTDILEDNIYDAGWTPPVPGTPFAYPNLSANYSGNINVLATTKTDGTVNNDMHGVFYMDDNPNVDPVLQMTGDIAADVAVRPVVAIDSGGGSILVAQGYAGLGKGAGSGGGVHVFYDILGDATIGGALSEKAIYYRHVIK